MPTRAATQVDSRPAAGSSRTASRAPAGAGGQAGGGKAGGGKAGGRTASATSYDEAALLPLLEALVAVRDGNFRQRLRPQPGLLGEIAAVVNELVEHNAHVAGELARVRRLVGREGRLGERLEVGTLKGSWAESVEAANSLVEDLVRPTVEVGRVIAAVAEGDLSPRIELRGGDAPLRGEFLRVGRTVNSMVDQLELFTSEVTRVAREVGTEGKLGGQARVRGVSGSWKDLTDSVNSMASRLTAQVRDIAVVTTAVANGDLSRKVVVEVQGEVLELKETVNRMVDQLSSFADEVTRVARDVGTEGKLGAQADVKGVSGTWKDLTDSVNVMASNLTDQVRGISSVARAVAAGDLTRTITVTARGEVAELAQVLNTMTETLGTFADEVTRVAREVGTEGKLGGQAQVAGVSGTWKDLTDSVNSMAGNLTAQVRDIAAVTTAVARGDLSQKITVDVKGELLELKSTVNTMVDQLSGFAAEVTRVAREVGSEGRLGGQAEVPGVSGTWTDLTDSVNFMAGSLTAQVRNIAQVTTAVAKGDLSQKITVDARGEILELKNTVNTMVDQLSAFAAEVTRVAREVGSEGKLGGQAQVPGVAGTWRDLTDSVNFMAGNLTSQVRSLAQVASAVERGDLSQKVTVEAKGEVAALAATINTMVDQLSSFAAEVTRVAREVGSEGRLGGQADVQGVSGTWKDLTESVNSMAGNLTGQVRNIAQVTTAVAKGDLSQKITVDARGEILELKNTVNTMVDQLSSFADEVTRVAREVGTEGKLGGQARVTGVSGTWKDLTDNVNSMAGNLTSQVRSIAQVATAVARGDLSQKITVEAKGEVAILAGTINTMVDTLRAFADEVTRVAREVGTEGILGGQAQVSGVSGTWKDLTDNVNGMAGNLTSQVRSIALVTTAVANGDLSKKIDVDVRGEILELKTTINTMVDQLSSFAAEVTRVAREVGTEGKLGGQAEVEGVSGTWKKLTENVNQLAGTLTTQLRTIAQVSTAVTRGDLTRQITVDASGEVAELKDNINQMIANLRETTRTNEEQDWLKTNLARISGLMQGRRDLLDVTSMIMSELTPVVSAQHGAFFLTGDDGGEPYLRLLATYGYKARKTVANRFAFGEALVGQAALERKPILVSSAPADYIRISSGLGDAPPVNVVVLPVLFEDRVLGIIELASFSPFSAVHQDFLDQLMESIGVSLNAIIASSRTEELLGESQRLAAELQEKQEELQAQQEELRLSNSELEQQAASLKASEELLQRQQEELQQTNGEIEEARRALEERAEQLALSSRYKSEFLANMSHELRTPLNSLLILARLLSDNAEHNLTPKQIEFARTIHNAGIDLLQLINDILDLSKVEAGKMDLHVAEVPVVDVLEYVQATFRPLTAEKSLAFDVEVAPDVPETLLTDAHRLQQILRNLLSNAVKFTAAGSVRLRMSRVDRSALPEGSRVGDGPALALSVRDTGIGIEVDKQRLIFEAFQQADGTTSRRYGGTGLGLSISREIAGLLGGEIVVESTPGQGSTFTLFLPLTPPASAVPALAVLPQPRTAPPPPPELPAESTPGEPAAARTPGRHDLLVVVDAPALAELAVRVGEERGFTVTSAAAAEEGLALAREHVPDAIVVGLGATLDDGRPLLEALKASPVTRHVPVHVLECPGEEADGEPDRPGVENGRRDLRHRALEAGALAVLPAPVTPEALGDALAEVTSFLDAGVRRLLVVEDDERERAAICELVGAGGDVEVSAVGTADDALAVLEHTRFDCMVLDLTLPGTTGFDLLEQLKSRPGLRHLPVIVYTGKELSRRDETRLRKYAEAIVVKDARSPQRLLDETALFLHRVAATPVAPPRLEPAAVRGDDALLAGRKVLVVDDDVRNVFALTSALEQRGMSVVYAENGREGIEILSQHPDVDVVLMDVMMPEMDGYATTRAIRAMPQHARLPVIALTAKAMKGDREKSIEAGASDYVPKPVDLEQLFSLLRVWLYR